MMCYSEITSKVSKLRNTIYSKQSSIVNKVTCF